MKSYRYKKPSTLTQLMGQLPLTAAAAIGSILAGKRAYRSLTYGRRPKAVAKPTFKPKVKPLPIKATSSAKSVKSRLNKLEKKVSGNTSQLIFKVDSSESLRPTSSLALYGYQSAVSTANIESAISQCRFFDPSTPGTLITGSLASPTYSQTIRVSVYSRLIITNNYQIPCIVTCGVVTPRNDTNITVTQSINNGLADVGNPDAQSTLISFNDSPQFRQIWKVSGKMITKRLAPGQSIILKHGQKSFMYDPAFTDSDTETYSKRNKSAEFCYRVQGVLAHDTAISTEQGMAPAGIDVYRESVITVYYNSGGTAIKTIVLSEGADQTFTNGAVVSQLVADNQAYSVS